MIAARVWTTSAFLPTTTGGVRRTPTLKRGDLADAALSSNTGLLLQSCHRPPFPKARSPTAHRPKSTETHFQAMAMTVPQQRCGFSTQYIKPLQPRRRQRHPPYTKRLTAQEDPLHFFQHTSKQSVPTDPFPTTSSTAHRSPFQFVTPSSPRARYRVFHRNASVCRSPVPPLL